MALADPIIVVVTLVAALGCGLVAGVFFAFSTFVMKALARIAPGEGIAAMQSINVAVINLWFMTVFLGTAALCVVLLILSLLRWHEAGAAWVLAGAVLYLVGTLLVTIAFNVPRNAALAAITPAAAEGARFWTRYVSEWTAWNHVRTLAALAAAAAFSIALGY
jgi:uncharacterized membrane protein